MKYIIQYNSVRCSKKDQAVLYYHFKKGPGCAILPFQKRTRLCNTINNVQKRTRLCYITISKKDQARYGMRNNRKNNCNHRGRLPSLLKPLPKLFVGILCLCNRLRIVLDEIGEELSAIDFVGEHGGAACSRTLNLHSSI